MHGRPLDVAFWNYDRTRALSDGRVKIEGVAARFHTARIVPEIFEATIRRRAHEVSELGLTYFLRTFASGTSPFLAIPVFPNRCFRHSAICVNAAGGIERPEDLAGRTVGELALHGHGARGDAERHPRGRVRLPARTQPPDRGRHRLPDEPHRLRAAAHPPDVEVTTAPKGTDLGALLEAGEIDAPTSADVPRCALGGSPRVRRLFPDHEAVERDYFRRTGIFPIMHAVVVTRDLAEREPEVVRAVHRGFCGEGGHGRGSRLRHDVQQHGDDDTLADGPARA